ncbi:MAG: ribonuclease P protein component [Patescibacteria group bacterium]
MALPRKYRLSKKDLGLVKKEGRLLSGPFFSLLTLEDGDSDNSQFAFVVSRKIDKRAVVRNRVRRLLAEAVRLNLDCFDDNLKLVFLTKPAIVKISLAEIEDSLRKLIGKSAEKIKKP